MRNFIVMSVTQRITIGANSCSRDSLPAPLSAVESITILSERNIRCVSLWDWNTVTLISFMPIDTAEFMVRGFHLLSIQAGRGMGLRFDSVAFENSRLSVYIY